MRDELQNELKKILLMPIEVKKVRTGKQSIEIYFDDGRICSSQQYKGNKDPDMSDIAIKFYEILYGFDEGKRFPCEMFAGDTMNSYNTVARFASEKVEDDWKNYYHCLANFWVLPMAVGRNLDKLSKASGGKQTDTVKSFKTGRRDYMDRFLQQYIESNDDYSKQYAEYTNKFPLSSFAKDHYLTGIYMWDDPVDDRVIKFSYIEDENGIFVDLVDGVISDMWEKIEARADLISKSDKADKLLEYFKEKYVH